MGFSDPFLNRPRIPMVIKGLRRAKSTLKQPEKLPITALVLYSLKLQLDLLKKDDIMLWAACCVAFFGFLRASEFMVPSSGFQPGVHLSVADISVDAFPLPSTAFVIYPIQRRINLAKAAQLFWLGPMVISAQLQL